MKIEKAECNYQVTECDLKFGEQITLDGELLIPVSVLDKIRAEISDFEEEVFQRPNTDYSDYAAVRHCLEIIDKYRGEQP